MSEESPTALPEPPVVGAVVDTVYGRQQVMDVLRLAPDELCLMYRRPVDGGIECSVPVADFANALVEVGL